MQGFQLQINIDNCPEDIRFRLYDNNEPVLDNIGTFDFSYLVPTEYDGVHTLSMTYFQSFNPSEESAQKTIYTKDFTLPTLDYTVGVEILS